MRRLIIASFLAIAVATPGCGNDPAPVTDPPVSDDDLPLGDVSAEDQKMDGVWGSALTCKPVPSLPPLVKPEIIVSLDAQTAHLFDRSTGYDKVFPIGVGMIDTKQTSATYLESLSYYPIIATGKQTFTIRPSSIQTCKTWWTDSATGQKSPVFAGLPFISWYGGYAFHGPIDNFRAPNGGNLRRGYVSHGCFRMEAADVLELYARIKGVAAIPVRVQREPERFTDGRRAEITPPWVGAECAADGDCAGVGTSAFCKKNKYSGRGFCSLRCTGTCPDRAGNPTTFCVQDWDDATKGLCTTQVTAVNYECRGIDHMAPRRVTRFRQPTVSATVCMPGSRGWIGDHCFADADCKLGNKCAGASAGVFGICTQACGGFCPDLQGASTTFCAKDPSLGQTCLRECTPASNAPECPSGSDCAARPRAAGGTKFACVPRR